MAIHGRLFIDGPPQFQRLDDALRGELEVAAHQLFELAIRYVASAKGVYPHADRLGNADGVSELHFHALGKACSHDVFGDVARHVACGAVNLGRIFAAEGAAAVASHATVSIHDDFAAGEAGIAHRPADHEAAGGIDVVLGISIEEFSGNGRLDDVLQNIGMQFLVVHQLGMLGGDDNCVHAYRLMVFVIFNCDLGFAIGPEVIELAGLANFGEAAGELMRQQYGRGHELFVFIGGVAEHHALIAGAAGIHTHSDVGRLRMDRANDRAGLGIEAVSGVGVADGSDHAAHDGGEIYVSFSGDLSGNEHYAGGGDGFAGDAAVGIFLQTGVEDGIRNLVGDLIGMAFGHRFRCKQKMLLGGQS